MKRVERITRASWDAAMRRRFDEVELVEPKPWRPAFITRMQERIWALEQQVTAQSPAEKLQTARRLIDEVLTEMP
jgi:hypothetical protein